MVEHNQRTSSADNFEDGEKHCAVVVVAGKDYRNKNAEFVVGMCSDVVERG